MEVIKQAFMQEYLSQVRSLYSSFADSLLLARGNLADIALAKRKLELGLNKARKTYLMAIDVVSSMAIEDIINENELALPTEIEDIDPKIRCARCGERYDPKVGHCPCGSY
ncbi:hypothetical protein ACFL53_05215 [Pseudomonadota bacterium]